LNVEYNAQEQHLISSQQEEMDNKIKEFEETYPSLPKPCVELLNLNKILELAVKQKEYIILFI
jgi:hypothetical protein